MKTKSIWGKPPTRLYRLINMAERDLDKDFTACIVGCSDGKFLMPFARKHIDVTGYDIDDVALYGGFKDFPIVDKKIKYIYTPDFVSKEYKLENKRVYGIVERIEKENLEEYTHIEKRDFYRTEPDKKFNVVFTSCSLHYSANQDFTLEDKTKKLQNIVSPGGYLYIDYMMAIDENNYEKYSKYKFYRKGEIVNYFDNNWQILFNKENNNPTFEGAHVDCVKDHFHRFGYVLAKRYK